MSFIVIRLIGITHLSSSINFFSQHFSVHTQKHTKTLIELQKYDSLKKSNERILFSMCKRLNVQYLTIFSVAILRSFQLLFTYFAHDNLLRVSFPKHRENIKTLMKLVMTCFISMIIQSKNKLTMLELGGPSRGGSRLLTQPKWGELQLKFVLVL